MTTGSRLTRQSPRRPAPSASISDTNFASVFYLNNLFPNFLKSIYPSISKFFKIYLSQTLSASAYCLTSLARCFLERRRSLLELATIWWVLAVAARAALAAFLLCRACLRSFSAYHEVVRWSFTTYEYKYLLAQLTGLLQFSQELLLHANLLTCSHLLAPIVSLHTTRDHVQRGSTTNK